MITPRAYMYAQAGLSNRFCRLSYKNFEKMAIGPAENEWVMSEHSCTSLYLDTQLVLNPSVSLQALPRP